MSLVVVEAAITVADPSTRGELLARTAPIQQATRDDEPGCLVYCFAADPCRDDLIQVYELWESEASLAAHFDHPNYIQMRDMLGAGGLVSAVSRKHRVDATASVYDASLRPNAGFDA
jgi:quinol monooxygenase YgiN